MSSVINCAWEFNANKWVEWKIIKNPEILLHYLHWPFKENKILFFQKLFDFLLLLQSFIEILVPIMPWPFEAIHEFLVAKSQKTVQSASSSSSLSFHFIDPPCSWFDNCWANNVTQVYFTLTKFNHFYLRKNYIETIFEAFFVLRSFCKVITISNFFVKALDFWGGWESYMIFQSDFSLSSNFWYWYQAK